MSDRIYRSYPKDPSEGPGDRPFYYGIRKGEEWKYIRITPFSDTKVLSSGNKILENNFQLPQGKKVLVIEPHSDDAAICTGNFLIKLREAGNQVHIVNFISCHLAVGGYLSLEEKKKIRDDEDRAFASRIGASIQFLRLEFPYARLELQKNKADGYLDLKNCRFGSPLPEDFDKVHRVLDSEKPDIVLLYHPFNLHQMHRDCTDMVLDAIAGSLPRRNEMRLLFFGGGNFKHFGVTTQIYNLFDAEEAEKKMGLIRLFRSQYKNWENNTRLFQFKGREISEEEISETLRNDMIDSLDENELNKEILRSGIDSPYCERFIEFKLDHEAHYL